MKNTTIINQTFNQLFSNIENELDYLELNMDLPLVFKMFMCEIRKELNLKSEIANYDFFVLNSTMTFDMLLENIKTKPDFLPKDYCYKVFEKNYDLFKEIYLIDEYYNR